MTLYEQILGIIRTNEFFQGGFLVAVISGVLMYVKSVPSKIYRFFDRYSTLYLNLVDSTDEFNWVSRHVNDLYEKSNYGSYTIVNRKNRIYTSIADYRYLRAGTFCWVRFSFSQRELDNKSGGGDAIAYSMSLKLYGFGKRAALSKIIEDAKVKYGPAKGRESLSKWNKDQDYWSHVCWVPRRSMDTVYSDAMSGVLEDIKNFQSRRPEYRSKGIPFRRGYLFFGPPGTGKTSSIAVMANELEMGVSNVNLSSVTGDSLISALSCDNRIIVFEDIDAISVAKSRSSSNESKERVEDEGFSLLTLSELLNAIDGSMTGQNLIFIFTTNHPEKLDPALMRPGRIDRKVLFGYMSQNELKKMTKVYFDRDCGDCLVRGDLTAAEAQNNYLTYDDYDTFMDFCCTSSDSTTSQNLIETFRELV